MSFNEVKHVVIIIMHVTTVITINTPPEIGVQVYKLLQVYSVKIKINSLVFVRNSKSNL